MQIFVKTLTCGTIALDVSRTSTIRDVKAKIRAKIELMFAGYDVEEFQEDAHGLEFAGKQLQDELTLSYYNIVKENTLHATSGLAGEGVKVIKKHLKKDDAVEALRNRAEKFYVEHYAEEVQTEAQLPERLNVFLDPIKQFIEEIKLDRSGELIQKNLRMLSNDSLEMMKDTMSQKVGRHTEEKVLKCIKLVSPLASIMDDAKSHINVTQAELVNSILMVYASEYNIYKDGSASFNNELFREHINSEQNKRLGANEVRANVPENRNCVIS